ncbi:MAG: glutathione S-transferase family protein [Ahrensia sp.]|nr:glutathione S-transferase family protein [Ahrensia sp.]
MADYTLHCFLESGNAYKPALMLELSGADWHAQWVDFIKGGEHRSPEFRAVNNMAEVPVLIDHTEGDLAISQSGVILTHLAEKTDQFGAQTKAEEREILRWLLWDNHKFTGNISAYRFMAKFMGKGDTETAQNYKARMISAIKTLNAHLDGRDWVAADRPTIADISLIGYCTWPDHFDVIWSDYPNIEAWLQRMAALPNYKTPEDILPTGPTA